MKRTMVFIDGANVFFTLLDMKLKPTIRYEKLVSGIMEANHELVRAYYYDAPLKQSDNPDRYKRQQKFFESVNQQEFFEVRYGRMANGRQKGVDVRLAVDMIQHALDDAYDTAILISGDSDLVHAVDLVKAKGKHVYLAFFQYCYHLKQRCDKYIPIDSALIHKCY